MPLEDLVATRPQLDSFVSELLAVWPEHRAFVETSLGTHGAGQLDRLDQLAGQISTLAADDRAGCFEDYRWTCERLLEEELHFRRSGAYRCGSFAEAVATVYSNAPFMKRYVSGLLVSQLLWANHAAAFLHFCSAFLPALPDNYSLLEVGPGHGLFLAQAAKDPRAATVAGWDVSAESVEQTRRSLARLGITRPVELAVRDVLAPLATGALQGERFDAIVVSEVLEHLEDPARAVRSLAAALGPRGRLFVNMPINSPAPDHIYLLRTPDEVATLLRESGLDVIDFVSLPMTGYTLKRALKLGVTVSCVAVATPRVGGN